MKMAIACPVFAVLTFVFGFCVKEVNCKEQSFKVLDTSVTTVPFMTKPLTSLEDCALLCLAYEPVCQSLKFSEITQICDLITLTELTSLASSNGVPGLPLSLPLSPGGGSVTIGFVFWEKPNITVPNPPVHVTSTSHPVSTTIDVTTSPPVTIALTTSTEAVEQTTAKTSSIPGTSVPSTPTETTTSTPTTEPTTTIPTTEAETILPTTIPLTTVAATTVPFVTQSTPIPSLLPTDVGCMAPGYDSFTHNDYCCADDAGCLSVRPTPWPCCKKLSQCHKCPCVPSKVCHCDIGTSKTDLDCHKQ